MIWILFLKKTREFLCSGQIDILILGSHGVYINSDLQLISGTLISILSSLCSICIFSSSLQIHLSCMRVSIFIYMPGSLYATRSISLLQTAFSGWRAGSRAYSYYIILSCIRLLWSLCWVFVRVNLSQVPAILRQILGNNCPFFL